MILQQWEYGGEAYTEYGNKINITHRVVECSLMLQPNDLEVVNADGSRYSREVDSRKE